MRKLLVISGCLTLYGCVQKEADKSSDTDISPEKTENTLSIADVSGKAFTFTPNFDEQHCVVEEDCDCCASDYLFFDDGSCLLEAYCLEGNEIFKGMYREINGKIEISYGGLAVLQEFKPDEPRGNDSIADSEPEIILKTRNVPMSKIVLTRQDCASGKLILNTNSKLKEFGWQNGIGLHGYTKRLKEEGVWQKLF